MIRISLAWMLQACAAIDRLELLEEENEKHSKWWLIFNAKAQMEALFEKSVYTPHLRVSLEKAQQLHRVLNQALDHFKGDVTQNEVNQEVLWAIKYYREQFQTVFMSELSILPTYLVIQKESYDVNTLTDMGWKLFPESLLQRVPEALPDAMEAGKALAYELGTAFGFHIFRVIESTLKRYWDEVSKGEPRPKLQTIGTYVKFLEEKKYGNEKVTETLKQLGRLHRNPLIHPEAILSVDEAIGILGIARSVVGAMLQVLPNVPQTTGAPSSGASAPLF